jgi:hypothetical protein
MTKPKRASRKKIIAGRAITFPLPAPFSAAPAGTTTDQECWNCRHRCSEMDEENMDGYSVICTHDDFVAIFGYDNRLPPDFYCKWFTPWKK